MILKYKIQPVSTKIVIFREQQCSELIIILIEFTAGFFHGIYETEKINFRDLKKQNKTKLNFVQELQNIYKLKST